MTGPASNWVVVGTRKSWLLVDGGLGRRTGSWPQHGPRALAFPEAVPRPTPTWIMWALPAGWLLTGFRCGGAAAELGNATGRRPARSTRRRPMPRPLRRRCGWASSRSGGWGPRLAAVAADELRPSSRALGRFRLPAPW
ncbi:hypothetical protein QJS66_23470 (plasmid) [Kocuria rhizophila]|nr:hypothetical protein QJS66_23470 [Kocuria rhizophila]